MRVDGRADIGTPPELIVTVNHECKDGWHTFTSSEIPGLFLTGKPEDLGNLYEVIPSTIAALIMADFGGEVTVKAEKTFDSYRRSLPENHRPEVRHYSIVRDPA